MAELRGFLARRWSGAARRSRPWRRLHSRRAVVFFFLGLGFVPLALLAYFSTSIAADAVRSRVRADLRATATTSALYINEELRGLSEVNVSFANRPFLVQALADGDRGRYDRPHIRQTLEELSRVRPGIGTAFIADPNGVLIDIVPPTPSIVGKDFSFRDWYKGLTRTGEPYVSEAYETQATGTPLVVALAAPVRAHTESGNGGKELAILVVAYRLDVIRSFTDRFAQTRGVSLTVTDQRGVLVAEPGPAPRELLSRRGDPRVAAALAGRTGISEYGRDGEEIVSAYAPIRGIGWTVTAEIPKSTAFAGVQRLRWTVAGISLLLALVLAGGVWLLARILRQRQVVEDQMRAVLDATPAGIVLLDPDGRRVIANRALERFVPPNAGEDLERRIAAGAERAVDPDAFRAKMQAILADPECEATERFDLVGGGCVELYSAPVRDARGELTGRIVTVRDITAEREAERVKDELVATVSHELRTPLASILGFSELLVTRDLDNATRERYLQTIYKEASRLTGLINDFLDLQRMESGSFTLDVEPFDLRDVLRHQVDVFSGQSVAHTIELAPMEPLVVAGDRDRVAQVVGNLLSNAIKYSPAGGSVGVRVDRTDGAVRVSVADHGLGIPAAQQGQIFTKFFRVDSSDTRKIGGTGLGLALTREIVEAHRGRIGFDSVEGEGTTFWFELPAGPRPIGRALDDGRPRALVVEDDLSAAGLLSEQLQEEGFVVEVAATGGEALEHVRARRPELVCLDVRLGDGLDGWQVLAELKAHSETADVPVVVVTAYNSREKAAALGAADFITKPFTAQRLREAVERVLPVNGRSVLVVDDEETVRRLVLDTLSDDGLELHEAADGEEALALIAERRPDAIVLDLLMPNLDGFAVLERLQDDPSLRSIPVIVLTAHRLSTEERRLLQKRVVSLLEKSAYSGAELRRLIDRALAGRRTD